MRILILMTAIAMGLSVSPSFSKGKDCAMPGQKYLNNECQYLTGSEGTNVNANNTKSKSDAAAEAKSKAGTRGRR